MASSPGLQPARDGQIESAKIIILAQSLSVTASVLGLIGLMVAYKALRRGNASQSTARVPTIS